MGSFALLPMLLTAALLSHSEARCRRCPATKATMKEKCSSWCARYNRDFGSLLEKCGGEGNDGDRSLGTCRVCWPGRKCTTIGVGGVSHNCVAIGKCHKSGFRLQNCVNTLKQHIVPLGQEFWSFESPCPLKYRCGPTKLEKLPLWKGYCWGRYGRR